MKSLSVTIQMKATEQYFPVVLFITLYKVILTLESVDELFEKISLNRKLLNSTFLWRRLQLYGIFQIKTLELRPFED